MDHVYFITTKHKKGKHISYEERMIIQLRLKDVWPANRIAREIGCAPNTVRNEIRRGTVELYHGHVQRYKAKAGQEKYEQNRSAFCGRALETGAFTRDQVVCTKTLYNYVDLGFMETRNHHLPEKLRRNTKAGKMRENKKNLGRSIKNVSEKLIPVKSLVIGKLTW